MEESVALDSSKQKQFVKSVRGIKKLLKKKNKKLGTDAANKKEPLKEPEPVTKLKLEKKPKIEKKKIKKASTEVKKTHIFKKRAKKGLVYLSHIPHGFYEHQMTEYFKQFGVVTNARVIRSSRTGNSKGYAFVEFKEPSVAEIVADTMNNYLMGKRLIKAVYIPPEKQKLHAMRKNWNNQNNPARDRTLKMKKAINANKSDKEEIVVAGKLLSSLENNKKKLKVLGIDYDFFMPVDIPEGLKVKIQAEVKDVSLNTEKEAKKKIKVEEKIKTQQKKVKNEPTENKNKIVNLKNENIKNKKLNKNKKETKSNEDQQKKENKNLGQGTDKNKQQKIEEIELRLEDFININTDTVDYDSDDSFTVNSDIYENMSEIDDEDDLLADEDEVDDDDDGFSLGEECDFDEAIKNNKKSLKDIIAPSPPQKENDTKKTTLKKKQVKEIPKATGEKRKKNINASVTPKKAKFEKQNKKTLKKVIKKRK